TRIVVTGDLDDEGIAGLADAPVDGYGVGTNLVTGLGQPTAGFVYKLVAIAGDDGVVRPVAKRSLGKATVGGRKWAWRAWLDAAPDDHEGPAAPPGPVLADIVGGSAEPPTPGARLLQAPVVERGRVVPRPSLEARRAAHLASRAELGPAGVLVTVRR
ncbi:MAG TPA: hypothetical protein VFP61_05750, partial [Acidimicrobiales bacterium]|nr:hypothetical protein [Acidimicrobiales bacterium]